MEVKVGVIDSHKELSVDVDGAADEVVTKIETAMSGDDSVLWLDDQDGSRVGIAVDKIAYVEIVGAGEKSQVGFGSG